MSDPISRRAWLARTVAGAALLAARPALAAGTLAAPQTPLTVYKDPNCGCCEKWVAHMAAAGFRPAVHDVADMEGVKRRLGVPQGMESCHTSVVEGFVLEGHVPAADVRRLLQQKPRGTKGLAVPGMPHGSPGMETGRVDRYDVVAFAADGSTRRFAAH